MISDLQNNVVSNENTGIGMAYGTFGELLQGMMVESNLDFLVTFPIQNFTKVIFCPDSTLHVSVIPEFKQKSARLAAEILKIFQLPPGGTICIESDLPVGKGLASSSADLVATARSIESYYGITVPLQLLQKVMKEIEPSDGVMYPEVVAFYHREVELFERLGVLPRLTVLAIDEGGEIDTIQYNRNKKEFTLDERTQYTNLMMQLKYAFCNQDVYSIGQVATRSALLNQDRLKKHTISHLLELSDNYNALGIIIAHSGTYIGILLSDDEIDYAEKLEAIHVALRKAYGEVKIFHSVSTKSNVMNN
ncbi:GHMP family kinase ATP-binding protein [Paenibacillus pabuli]|uniref:GHMP family kinase ATP-binding protein n=1 Tax=Paenibacillus pabuli TaxID=1472 RepID=UPI000AD32C0F|nr:kinase [Paenibacillus pabuli]MEC0129336.1 kinase [Paenibacillus pabuli]